MRAGEIFNLTWNDIDFKNGFVFIKDAKNGKNRKAVIGERIRPMLEERYKNSNNMLVFPSAKGDKITDMSNTFARVVEMLGFNKNISDRRQKVVFHTLRHTFVSNLVMKGINLYTVQQLMGHSTITMTERYAHLSPNHLKKAINVLEKE